MWCEILWHYKWWITYWLKYRRLLWAFSGICCLFACFQSNLSLHRFSQAQVHVPVCRVCSLGLAFFLSALLHPVFPSLRHEYFWNNTDVIDRVSAVPHVITALPLGCWWRHSQRSHRGLIGGGGVWLKCYRSRSDHSSPFKPTGRGHF